LRFLLWTVLASMATWAAAAEETSAVVAVRDHCRPFIVDGGPTPTGRVHLADGVEVSFSELGAIRVCQIVFRGAAADHRGDLIGAMAAWPAHLEYRGDRGPNVTYAKREAWCGAPEGPHDFWLMLTRPSGADLSVAISRTRTRATACEGRVG
jgi:hypothetical protein